MKAKHKGSRRSCDNCGKAFKKKMTLGKHEYKKFDCARTCRMCGKQFKLSGDLGTHMDKYKDASSVKLLQTCEDCS